ncbi:hypothetical protein B0H19DRAFT_1225905 [Mycena capillaripes]|nr:hypothetical protein B0H19DRAFT_1225905 [Mycena capillaripes]
MLRSSLAVLQYCKEQSNSRSKQAACFGEELVWVMPLLIPCAAILSARIRVAERKNDAPPMCSMRREVHRIVARRSRRGLQALQHRGSFIASGLAFACILVLVCSSASSVLTSESVVRGLAPSSEGEAAQRGVSNRGSHRCSHPLTREPPVSADLILIPFASSKLLSWSRYPLLSAPGLHAILFYIFRISHGRCSASLPFVGPAPAISPAPLLNVVHIHPASRVRSFLSLTVKSHIQSALAAFGVSRSLVIVVPAPFCCRVLYPHHPPIPISTHASHLANVVTGGVVIERIHLIIVVVGTGRVICGGPSAFASPHSLLFTNCYAHPPALLFSSPATRRGSNFDRSLSSVVVQRENTGTMT